MVDLYTKLIIKKKRTFDQVPNAIKEQVKEELARKGYDTNGDLLSTDENNEE